MYFNYSEIPERLSAYRRALDKTQVEMSEVFAVNQSHYNKLESGQKVISYRSMLQFIENGGDIVYLITGKEYCPGFLNDYINCRKTDTGRVETLKAILWLTKQGILYSGSNLPKNVWEEKFSKDASRSLEKSWKYVAMFENEESTGSIWENIRIIERISQVDMAGQLEIDIKRYRRLEKLMIMPDAAILQALYNIFGYSPMIAFDKEIYCVDEINKIWNLFPNALRKELEAILKRDIRLISRYERD